MAEKYSCIICGYVYSFEEGDKEDLSGTRMRFEDLPDKWVCPECGAEKDDFEKF
ncbi:MAG: rubredoxin [Candidatus Omnitrophota bacterium]